MTDPTDEEPASDDAGSSSLPENEEAVAPPGALSPRAQDPPASSEDDLQEIFEGIPVDPEIQPEIIRRFELHRGTFASPLPPPYIIREYGEILDSAPERLFAMTERQAAHRQEMEKYYIRSSSTHNYVAQASALLVALVFGLFAFILIYNGHEISGTILGGADLVALVSVFLWGRQQGRDGDEDEDD